MVKALLGFAIGVILTGLAFLYLYAGPGRLGVPADYANASRSSVPNSPGSVGDSGVANTAVDTVLAPASERSASTEAPAALDEDPRSRRQRLQARFDEAGRAVMEAINAQDEASRALREFDFAQLLAEPIINPLPLPGAFEWLTDGSYSTYRRNHERIQRESRDDSWAAPTEQQLWSFLNDRPEFTRTYGAPTVTCAETLCEITVVRYGVSADVSFRDFDDLRLELISHPDYRDLFEINPQWVMRNEDEVAALFVILERREEPSQTQSRVETALR